MMSEFVHTERKAEAVNDIFVEDTTNNISSFKSCHQCMELYECERDIEKLDWEDSDIISRQINCIINVLKKLDRH